MTQTPHSDEQQPKSFRKKACYVLGEIRDYALVATSLGSAAAVVVLLYGVYSSVRNEEKTIQTRLEQEMAKNSPPGTQCVLTVGQVYGLSGRPVIIEVVSNAEEPIADSANPKLEHRVIRADEYEAEPTTAGKFAPGKKVNSVFAIGKPHTAKL